MPHRQDKLKTRRRILTAVVVVFSFIALFRSAPPQIVSNISLSLASPVWRTEKIAEAVLDNIVTRLSGDDLVEKNRKLQIQITELNRSVQDKDALSRENRKLKALLGRIDDKEVILAGVLARPPRTPYDTLIVDVGEVHGIKEGAMVFASDGVVLGEIIDISKNQSKALLYSTNEVETNVYFSKGEFSAIAVGQGGGNFIIRLPEEVPVFLGDDLVTEGISSFVVAKVGDIVPSDIDISQTILARSPINTSAIKFVLVEKIQ